MGYPSTCIGFFSCWGRSEAIIILWALAVIAAFFQAAVQLKMLQEFVAIFRPP